MKWFIDLFSKTKKWRGVKKILVRFFQGWSQMFLNIINVNVNCGHLEKGMTIITILKRLNSFFAINRPRGVSMLICAPVSQKVPFCYCSTGKSVFFKKWRPFWKFNWLKAIFYKKKKSEPNLYSDKLDEYYTN